jgi:hypothetical protein
MKRKALAVKVVLAGICLLVLLWQHSRNQAALSQAASDVEKVTRIMTLELAGKRSMISDQDKRTLEQREQEDGRILEYSLIDVHVYPEKRTTFVDLQVTRERWSGIERAQCTIGYFVGIGPHPELRSLIHSEAISTESGA